jgi:hypothetical protein
MAASRERPTGAFATIDINVSTVGGRGATALEPDGLSHSKDKIANLSEEGVRPGSVIGSLLHQDSLHSKYIGE